ncbi:MAG: LysR family transcriptional regulator [Gammaproteobacteria bacterium]|nr:LysR family transcriptional regulator [Gammaproteobacteria bacterium]
MDRIDTLNAFLTVAQEGSFTKAAEKLGLSNQLVSKYVSELERQLGVRLLNRTTRRVNLTEAGEQGVAFAQTILESLNDLTDHFAAIEGSIQGRLRVNAPVSFATLHLSQALAEFMQHYPEVTVDMQLNDRKVDLIEEGYDVALRIGQLKSSSLIAKKLAPIQLMLCAAPEYLARVPALTKPEDLLPEDFLMYSYMTLPTSENPLLETLRRYAQQKRTQLSCNNGEILMASAIAGLGYVLQPTFIVGDAIKSGDLCPLFEEYAPESLGLYAVFPHRQMLAPKLRVFIDFLSDYFGQQPYWDNY